MRLLDNEGALADVDDDDDETIGPVHSNQSSQTTPRRTKNEATMFSSFPIFLNDT
jgi:hypothetical protein